ncbi:MAG: cysteine desulfurase [Stenotrophomonas sp.]|nr:cysteine desulfurase [Stenotrophomonas sp.]
MHDEQRPIYLDNNATTALDPDVLQAMMPYLTRCHGNAASRSHAFGWEASHAVDTARAAIATAINAARPADIIFTSGATESVNLALAGLRALQGASGGHVITSMIEHKAVLDSCSRLGENGVSVTCLRPRSDGIVSPQAVRAAIRDDTRLVSIMAANNETGTLQPLEEIGDLCRERAIPFHTDATQAFGKVAIDVRRMNISMASFSAHKIHGPKGVGALYVESAGPGLLLSPLIVGGGHERGLRSGTLNVPGIVGFGRAAELALQNLESESWRVRGLKDALRRYLVANVPGVEINGHLTACLPGTLNVSFANVDASSLLLELPDIALSSGSACTSAQQSPSHVLLALGASQARIQSSVRIGIGRFNTEEEVRHVGARLAEAVEMLRSMVPAATQPGS